MSDQISNVDFDEDTVRETIDRGVIQLDNLSDFDLSVIALTDDEIEDLEVACKLRSFIIRLNKQGTRRTL